MLVNGVLASCHTVVESHRLQRFYFQLMEKWMSVARTLFGRWTAELLFGPLDSDQKDIPFGVGTALELLELVMPKNIRLLV
ncbi:unnamed protein product [Toxocara canis]|uniref:Uncharacterized protein n=1 Tax=Toxocara canis TaxID=6265 RepID=A0A3P7F7U7_TOXCA|nr:unnamed protein product [Toxocara canis]